MRYNAITTPDVNNGTGCRITLWVSGCNHYCKGCHNPGTWNKDGGNEFTDEVKQKLFKELSKPFITGLTLSGGDPMSYYYDDVIALCKEIKENPKFKKKTIWLYTGYLKKDLNKDENRKKIFDYIDVIVDGPFVLKKRDITIPFRGSTNQKIWNVTHIAPGKNTFEEIFKIIKE